MTSFLKPFGVFLGMASFTGSHYVLSSEPYRDQLIAKRVRRFLQNVEKYMGIYSLVAAGTLFPTILFYAKYARGTGPRLWSGASRFAKLSGFSLKVLGVITLSQALTTPNPIQDISMKRNNTPVESLQPVSDKDLQVQGIFRVTRHALFLSFALLGLGNLCVLGSLADIFFWGSFPLVWTVGSYHQDQRLSKVLPASFYEQTSLWPFQAVYEKRQDLDKIKEEVNGKAIAVALLSPLFFL